MQIENQEKKGWEQKHQFWLSSLAQFEYDAGLGLRRGTGATNTADVSGGLPGGIRQRAVVEDHPLAGAQEWELVVRSRGAG